MSITIENGGEVLMLSTAAALNRLPDDVDPGDVLTRIGRGEKVPVRLSDGRQVFYRLTSQPHRLEYDPAFAASKIAKQKELPLDVQPYQIGLKLLFAVSATAFCGAKTEAEAVEVLHEAFNGSKPTDRSRMFRIQVDEDELDDTLKRVGEAFLNGQPRDLPTYHLEVTSVEQIEGRF